MPAFSGSDLTELAKVWRQGNAAFKKIVEMPPRDSTGIQRLALKEDIPEDLLETARESMIPESVEFVNGIADLAQKKRPALSSDDEMVRIVGQSFSSLPAQKQSQLLNKLAREAHFQMVFSLGEQIVEAKEAARNGQT